jgi:quinoprotein dehydrogenase-associated probable ABC transporter substrate-binding protein
VRSPAAVRNDSTGNRLHHVRVISRAALAAILVAVMGFCSGDLAVWAQTGEIIDRSELRVCADPSNLPFSNEREEGFENRIAKIVADELHLPVSYYWFPQIVGFVRNTLRVRQCDLVMGTVAGDDIMQTTNPYYYSTYVMIVRSDRSLSLSGVSDPKLGAMRIGVVGATPPTDLLVRHGLMANTKPYALTVDTRHESPAHQLVQDVASGEIDVGLVWGPIAGYYIKRDALPLRMTVLRGEPDAARTDYRIAMGVRANEPEWRRRINAIILKRQRDITAVLRDYGVPLLDEQGELSGAP